MAWDPDLGVKPNDLRLVDASAGSGKTFTLMNLVGELIAHENEDAGCILATTFTNKAAAELRQRIRGTLLKSKRPDASKQAAKAANGLIGTVNGVAGRILFDYAIDAGMSPQLEVIQEDAADLIFKRAVAAIIEKHADEIRPVATRLGFVAVKQGQHSPPDWQSVVHAIVDRARANGIDGAKLSESRRASINTAKCWFDGSVELSLEGIVKQLKSYESELEREDVGKGTKEKYFAKVKSFLQFPTWDRAVAVAEAKDLGKKDITPLRDVAASLSKNLIHATEMRDDVIKMITLVFNIAAEGMDAYQQFKARYGLIDFTDQESELLKLLQDDKFKAKLSERVHRVLVDEFQDTSPIQLALFSKLGEVAGGKMTWVGDPKQSIYGFRGADPALMAKAASLIDKKNRAQLKYSWRSKENLVGFSNVLFDAAFKGVAGCDGTVHLDIPDERKEKAKGGEIEAWMLCAKKVEDRSKQLVEGIRQLKDSGTSYGEIAVLMRTADDCNKLAKALSERGIPVSVGGGELFSTDEVRLAMAAYRYVVDRDDKVALAILAAYLIDPEGWLEALSVSRNETIHKWDAACKLESLNGDVASLTPLELLDRVIVHFGIDAQARKMGEGSRRIANLEELRAKCMQYMSASALKGVPATHAGFIASANGDNSKEASVPGGDSVKVMTYHAAKGLEWPTVVLSTLAGDYKRNPFDLEIVETEGFDPANPLKGRKLRWVPCPFGSLKGGFKTSLLRENAGLKDEFDRIHDEELEERKRLMYVGVTRARDRLVFAPEVANTKERGSEVVAGWLDELTPQSFFSGNWKLRNGVDTWTMGDTGFQVTTRVFTNLPECRQIKYERSAGHISTPIEFPLYKLAPSSKNVLAVDATVGEEHQLGTSLEVRDAKFTAELGDCFHGYMAVAVPGKDNPELAAALIKRWGQQGVVTPEELVACGARLRNLILKKWPGAVIETEIPMSYTNAEGQLSEGYIDVLVKTSDGKYVIIDHKVVGESDVLANVKKYAGQQSIYKQAVVGDKGGSVSVYLNLPHQGKLVEMMFAYAKDEWAEPAGSRGRSLFCRNDMGCKPPTGSK